MAKLTRAEKFSDLPSRLTVRSYTNKHGITSSFYYYEMPRDADGKRKCVALGQNRELAIARAKEMTESLQNPSDDDFAGFFAEYFVRLRKNAKIRGIPFELTLDDLLYLYKRSNGLCEVSGIRLTLKRFENNWRVRPWVPSVDRISSSGPYSRANCRMVCFYVNQAINEFGLETFLDVCKQVASFGMAKSSVSHLGK